jgi:hypothetical protein
VPLSVRKDDDEEEVKVEPVDRVKLRYRFIRFQPFWFFRHPTVGPNDRGEVAVDEKGAKRDKCFLGFGIFLTWHSSSSNSRRSSPAGRERRTEKKFRLGPVAMGYLCQLETRGALT